jgi:phenylpropionate dioxygenase-like ring-hydroxylating dioxygenase large terminal subunit
MIPNQWYAILESREVKRGKPTGVTRMGEKLVLWRSAGGELVCMRDLCAHRGAALSAGRIVAGHIQCPFHGFEYDSTGRCTLIPANGKDAPVPGAFRVHTYPTREAHGFVWMWWGEPRAGLPPVRFFDSIDDSMPYATLRDHWATHYSRAIENQLDVVHLPFVHRTTIGRGNRTLVDGPLARWECRSPECNLLNIWVYNRVDDGTAPLKPGQIPEPQRHPFLQFRFPNVWHNWIGDQARVVVAFAPIDDENTMMYVRYYQEMVRLPVLRELVNLAGLLFSLVIERQDRRVVVTQRPKRTDRGMGEKLIQGDGPVIAYRRRRAELIRQIEMGLGDV